MPFFTSMALFSSNGKFPSGFELEDSISEYGLDDLHQLVGKSGRALTDLHPGGRALIEGKRVDVIAEIEYIEAHSSIHVLKVEGSKITVSQSASVPN